MTKIDQLREQIDACRPGTGDLSLPALAELALVAASDQEVAGELARSQAFDRRVRDALDEAPIPVGLADRLIAALQAEAAPAVVLAERGGANEGVGGRRRRLGRRQWWLAGGAAALAAMLVVFALSFVRPGRDVVAESLGADVAGWLSNLPANQWQPVATLALPIGMDLDPGVSGKAIRWQSFPARGNSNWTGTVTAIDLRRADQPRAILFVVRSTARFKVPPTPTLSRRLALSGGFAATAWQRRERGLLFVLVVEEDRGQRLEDFLRKPTQA